MPLVTEQELLSAYAIKQRWQEIEPALPDQTAYGWIKKVFPNDSDRTPKRVEEFNRVLLPGWLDKWRVERARKG